MEKNESIVYDASGQLYQMTILSMKDSDGFWSGTASARFGFTRNGSDWATEDFEVAAIEKTPDAAMATLMLHISNLLSSPEFAKKFNNALDAIDDSNTEQEEEDAETG